MTLFRTVLMLFCVSDILLGSSLPPFIDGTYQDYQMVAKCGLSAMISVGCSLVEMNPTVPPDLFEQLRDQKSTNQANSRTKKFRTIILKPDDRVES